MRDLPRVRDVRLALAPRSNAERGLIGWVRLRCGPLELDGIALRRSRKGHAVLSWPCKFDRRGRGHAIVRPLSRDARRELDRQILDALGLGSGGAP